MHLFYIYLTSRSDDDLNECLRACDCAYARNHDGIRICAQMTHFLSEVHKWCCSRDRTRVQEAMMEYPIRGADKSAKTIAEHECNMQALLDFLSFELIGTDLGHICGDVHVAFLLFVDIFFFW